MFDHSYPRPYCAVISPYHSRAQQGKGDSQDGLHRLPVPTTMSPFII